MNRSEVARACLLIAIAAPMSLGAQSGNVRAELTARVDELLAAFRKGDARGVAQIFRDDASIVGPGTRVIGRAAIDSYWAARPRPTTWKIETLDVGGDTDEPWHYARSIRVNSTATGSDTTITNFILVWKRSADGKLRVYLDLFY